MQKRSLIRKSLWYSILDGSFYAAMVGFGESFFSAFAVFLKATSTQLGLLGSLPMMLGSLVQLGSTSLMKMMKSRKRLVLFASLLQALMYLPIALVFFFGTLRVYHLILFVCIYWVFSSMITPAWSSWMGDLVPERQRGAYFGRRNKITGMVTFVSFTLGGYFLEMFADGVMTQYIGFAVLFVLAMAARIVSFTYLSKKYEPPYELHEELQFSFWQFLKEARFHNYGLFVMYLGVMYFSVYIASPFFTPYMLEVLDFSYASFTVVTATAIVVKFLAMPVWGRLSDRYGTKKVLSASGFLMPLVPVLWLFSTNFWYLIAIQAFSGFAWAGFEIAAFNFIFDTTTPEKRATCVAYNSIVTGVMVFLGAMIGSLMLKHITWAVSAYYLVFLLSYVARSLSSIFFLPYLKERRDVRRISYGRLIFKAVEMMPNAGMTHRLLLFHNKKKG